MNTARFPYLILALLLTPFLRAQELPSLENPQTIITSDQLEMENRDESNHFFFKGKVRITGNNLIATCDEMEVITRRNPEEETTDSASKLGNIEIIIATGNVHIEQTGRKATSNRAEIHPNDEYIELIGNVQLENEHGTVTGPRFILEKDKRARMLGDGSDDRPTVTLPGFNDLGVDEDELLKNDETTEEDIDADDDSKRGGKR